jgi:hypothetical protein
VTVTGPGRRAGSRGYQGAGTPTIERLASWASRAPADRLGPMIDPQRRGSGRWVVAAGLLGYTAVSYAVVVLGLGALAGRTADDPAPLLSVLATLLVATTLEPLGRRLHRVFPATAEERLSRISDDVAAALATEDVLPGMARAIGKATSARTVEVRVRLPETGDLVQRWPAGTAPVDRTDPNVAVRPVRYREDRLGELVVALPARSGRSRFGRTVGSRSPSNGCWRSWRTGPRSPWKACGWRPGSASSWQRRRIVPSRSWPPADAWRRRRTSSGTGSSATSMTAPSNTWWAWRSAWAWPAPSARATLTEPGQPSTTFGRRPGRPGVRSTSCSPATSPGSGPAFAGSAPPAC